MAKIRLLFTGGHAATAAIAVLQEIRKIEKFKEAEVFWVGSKTAVPGKNIPSLESKALPSLGVEFYSIPAGKLQTKFTIHTIPSILKIPLSFFLSLIALIRIRPKVVMSFGGFSSFGVAFWSKILGIPVVIHEQTAAVGRAFLASIPFASKILLARSQSGRYMGKKKFEVVGNPLRSEILEIKKTGRLPETPTILVSGGSRGSNFLNELVYMISRKILPEFKLIHITGENDYPKANVFRQSLPKALKDNYIVFPSVDPGKMAEIYRSADMAIARSGANTVSELIYIKIPSIFVPLPRTYLSEQERNAEFASDFGLGPVLAENEATPERVILEIHKLKSDWEKIYNRFKNKKSPDIDASKKITANLSEYC